MELDFTKAVRELDAELELIEKRKNTLNNLLNDDKFSSANYNQLNERLCAIMSKIRASKEAFEEEELFWNSKKEEVLRIFEMLLSKVGFDYLDSKINEEDWKEKSYILTLGIDSIKAKANQSQIIDEQIKPVPSTLQTDNIDEAFQNDMLKKTSKVREERVIPEMDDQKPIKIMEKHERIIAPPNISRRKSIKRRNSLSRSRDIIKTLPEIESNSTSDVHCRNPWDNQCRNTDIQLSIYYKGEQIPICHKCWEEISKKNLEW